MSKNLEFVWYIVLSIIFGTIIVLLAQNTITLRPNAANVSRDNISSYEPSLILDSKDNPHIAWYGGGYGDHWQSNEIRYVKWDNGGWFSASGIGYNGNANVSRNKKGSDSQCLVLDTTDNPHLSWSESMVLQNNHIVYLRWDGSNWVTANDNLYKTSKGSGRIEYTSSSTSSPSLVLGSNNQPTLVFSYENNIVCIKYDGENWVSVNGDIYVPEENNSSVNKNNGEPSIPKLALDSNDNPMLLWKDGAYNAEYSKLLFVKWNGLNWVTINNDVYNPLTDNAVFLKSKETNYYEYNLVIDSDNNPHIAWHNTNYEENDTWISYIHWNGENWLEINETVFSTNSKVATINTGRPSYRSFIDISIFLDSDSKPHLAWNQQNNGQENIYYTKWNGSDWTTINNDILEPTNENGNISRNNLKSVEPDIALSSSDVPHIIWHDSKPREAWDEIMYIKWNGENWVCADGSVYKPSK
ncbi:MAG: hypothetical protein KAH30_06125 [Caldisericia bacterium]|nr:hypothetical protein [Caldisericia bacterium]